MTPVARRVTNRKKDRSILRLCFAERLFAPRKPIHRIVRMLEQVRRLLVNEPIRRRLNAHSLRDHT